MPEYPLPQRHPEPNEWRGHSIKLAAEVRELHAALDELVEAARTFSTESDYTVAQSVEEEFVAALERAENLVRDAA